MRRVILFVSVLTLFLSGCNYPSDSDALSAESPLPPTGEPSPPSAPAATNTLVHTPTTAPTLEATEPPPPPTDTVSDLRMLPLTPGDEFILTQISMINQSTGWGIGHQIGSDDHILRTKDGGQTWFDLTPPETPPQQGEPKKIAWGYFADAENAWVIYAYEKWSVIPPAPRVWKTADGGASWQASQELSLTGQEDSFLPEGFTFSNNEHGWLLIHIGGGMHHDYSLLFGTGDFGDSESQDLTYIYVTGDRGQSWQHTKLPSPVNKLDFINYQTGWATGRDIYMTTDGGLSWVKIKTVNWDGQFSFVDAQTGWAVAVKNDTAALVKTDDSGRTWELILPLIGEE
ncbi:MAG: hypothetical protein B6243_02105 [Anaerolineaceae bacterium 4572_5.2]|nr:MAG: hypothetical protein B6243_02105 [Anaerolineaceae bacterium 4572_5.2]